MVAQEALDSALAAFRKAWHSGERPDPDRFCQSHPECGPELRARIENFLFVAEGLPEAGQTPHRELAADRSERQAWPNKPGCHQEGAADQRDQVRGHCQPRQGHSVDKKPCDEPEQEQRHAESDQPLTAIDVVSIFFLDHLINRSS